MKQENRAKPIERFDTIDLLRGLSVLGVVYLHITYGLVQYVRIQVLPVWLQTQYGILGGVGVACFFAISGFLITYTSIRRFGSLAAMRPVAFYRIRFARIAPPLLLLLCILSGLHLANLGLFHIDPNVSTLPKALFAVLTFQFNHLIATRGWLPNPWVPLWTLSVEEMFYLCFPLLCSLVLRRRWGMPVFLAALVGFVVVGPLARISSFTSNPMWAEHSYLSNMDNIALGCLFGLLASKINSRFALGHTLLLRSMQIAGAVLMVFACVPSITSFDQIFRIQLLLWNTATNADLLGLGTCLVMLGSVLHPLQGSRFTLPLRWIGRYSYEVYLSHEFVIIALLLIYAKVQKGPLSLWAIAIIVLSSATGYLISRFFSEPMNRLLRGAPLPAQLRP